MKVRNEAPVFTLVFWGWTLFGILLGIVNPLGWLAAGSGTAEVFIAVWASVFFGLFFYGLVSAAKRRRQGREEEEE